MNDFGLTRADVISENLARAELRIAQASQAFGRVSPNTDNPITLIVVTKTYPDSDIKILHDLGVRNVGENRDQEARAKAAQSPSDLQWHMIGQIQRNKINSIASWADVIHTCDRLEIVAPMSKAAVGLAKELEIFIQVNLDPAAPENRGGIQPVGLLPLAAQIASAPGLLLRGLMAVAPHPTTGIAADTAFERLAELSHTLVTEYPYATAISAGMSHDLEAAIEFGATHVRLGSAILGGRPVVQ